MPAKKAAKKAKATGKRAPFTATDRPNARKGRLKKERAGSGRWNAREVVRLAEAGVESADIARHLKLNGRLQQEQELRAKFDDLVADGHATHRVNVAKRLKAEADKGRSNALRDVAKAWIARYSDEVLTGEDEAGIIARIQELVARLKKRNASSTSV